MIINVSKKITSNQEIHKNILIYGVPFHHCFNKFIIYYDVHIVII